LPPAIAMVLDSEKPTAVVYLCLCTAIDVTEPVAGFKRKTADPFVLDLRERLNVSVEIEVLSALPEAL